jgi:tryptophanyl-tRNA synthetase
MCSTAGWGCLDCKRVLFDGIKRELEPIHARARELRANPQRIHDALARGAERCRTIARETMHVVRSKMGLA